MSLLLKIESLVPRKISESIGKKIGFSGDNKETRKKVGFIVSYPFFVGILIVVIIFAVYGTISVAETIASYIAGVLVGFAGLYMMIDYQSMQRARKIESDLPDALELISVNMGSGLTVENALVESARPEFGELAIFLKRAAKEIYSGSAIEKAFGKISERVDSEVLHRSILLINEGMKKGAALGDLLLRISTDLRNEASLKKEINANISMYLMLIMIASCLGAPVLFGAGSVVSMSFAKQGGTISTSDYSSRMPLFNLIGQNSSEAEQFSLQDLELISIVSLAVTCLFASMIMGVIKYNRETPGLRYFLPMLIISLVIYYMSIMLLRRMVLGI